jgi:aspartate/methionine/tyrosine aminotransferase
MASAAGGANGGCWQPSKRSAGVQSFKVMDVLARAGELEREGRSIVHMEVGQPQTGGPRGVVEAAKKALDEDRLGYTAALGTTSLRERIATHYQEKYGVAVAPSRVVVTTGSSGAFLLSFISLFDAGDRVALASAGYPCYRNILNALGCEVVTVPINEEYKVTAKELGRTLDTLPNAAEKPLKGIILSSPSNPTGAMLTPSELEEMAKLCESRGVAFISDEIYHGICFGKEDETALRFSSRAWVINSFSKYYSMTGWRLGWMIVPESFVDPVNRLAQNMYINAPTLSQIAAVAAFDCKEELEGHMLKYKENRSILLDVRLPVRTSGLRALCTYPCHSLSTAGSCFHGFHQCRPR